MGPRPRPSRGDRGHSWPNYSWHSLIKRRLCFATHPLSSLLELPSRRETMKTPIALALLAILMFATSPAAAVERACRPSLSNGYHCPDTSASQPRRRSESASRPCRPSLSNGYSCPGTSSEGRGYAPSNRTASTIVGRACRMGSTALAKGRRASTNIRRKRWQGCIAPLILLCGQTPARVFTTSAVTTITAPPNGGPICVSGTRSREAYAWRRMKDILEPSRGRPVKCA